MPASKDIPTPFLGAHKAASLPLILAEAFAGPQGACGGVRVGAHAAPPPHWVITPQCLLGIRQCTDGNQRPSFLIKKETGVGGREEEGGENHSANR